MKKIFLFLILIIIFLQHRLWVGDDGIKHTFNLKKQIEIQNIENEKLIKANELLRNEISFLKENKIAIENKARNDLGMIQKGEIFYRIVENNKY